MKLFDRLFAGSIAILLAFPIAPSAIAYAADGFAIENGEAPVISDRLANDGAQTEDAVGAKKDKDVSSLAETEKKENHMPAENKDESGDLDSGSVDKEASESEEGESAPDAPIDLQSFANSWRFSDGLPANAISSFARVSGNAWSEKDGIYYCSDGTVVTGAEAFGIDVSQWNGDIDWGMVKAAGVDYAIIRCGYGGDSASQDDLYFVQNVKGALAAGLDIGVYIYSYGWDAATGKSEAKHVLRTLKEAGLKPSDLAYPVYYDLEQQSVSTGKPCGIDDSGKERPASNTALLSMTQAFAAEIEAAGYDVGVYANLNWWNNYLTSSTYDQWDRWVAQYNTQCDYRGKYSMWQCMSDGRIAGISGYTDINFYFGSGYGKLDSLAAENADVLPDGVYTIATSNDSSKVLDVASASISNSANVQIYANNGTNAQQWKVTHDAQGYVTFTNVNSGKVLDVFGGKSADGTNVQQYANNNSRAQKWIVIDNGDGAYVIRSAVKYGMTLDVKSGSTANKANVQIYVANGSGAQNWIFEAIEDPRASLDALAAENKDVLDDGDTYYIASALGSGSLAKATAVLDVKSAGTADKANVQIYAANATKAQQWVVSHDDQGYVTFTNANSGKVLDVASGKYSSGTNVQQYASNNTYSQKWIVTKEDGGYAIHSALWWNVVLDVCTGTTSNSSNVQVKALNESRTPAARALWAFQSIDDTYAQLNQLATANKDVLSDGAYVIKSALANTKVLDVASGSVANSANVQLYESNMTGAQQWRVTHDGQGYVTFTNVKSGKVLDVKSAKFANSTNVQQYALNDTRSQKWIVSDNGDGSFTIQSALWAGLVLDVKSASTANKANVQLYASNATKAQSWQFLTTEPTVEPCDDLGLVGTYVIASSVNDSYVLDVKGASVANGANVQLYKFNGTTAQKFKFVYCDGYYQIVNVRSGKALDVEDGNLTPAANVQQWNASTTNDNQLFSVLQNDDGSYAFVNKATGLILDVKSGKAANGSNVQVYTSNGTAAQSFILKRQ